MLINRAHKVRLYPNDQQATYLAKSAGTARFAYNWALASWTNQYEQHKLDPSLPKPSEAALRRELNAVKRKQYPWMLEVTKSAPQQAIKDLGTAYRNFFKGTARFPKFKRKGKSDESFYLDNTQVQVVGKQLKIPKLKQTIRMAEEVRWPDAKLLSARISKKAGKWYCSFSYQLEVPDPAHGGPAVGCDLGVKELATLSDGTLYRNPSATKWGEAKLRLLNKQLSRRRPGSKNRAKTKQRLANHHEKIKNQRIDAIHKMTTQIASTYSLVGLETLNPSGMVKNLRLAKAVQDASFAEVTRQLLYKVEAAGGRVHRVDRFFPSSKMCNQCGVKNQDLKLAHRVWECSACGAAHDRDINAAINLLNEAVAASSAVIACGDRGSGHARRVAPSGTKPPSGKQEPSSVSNHA